jgi:V8-like Glu-specific endopeptidase
VSSYVVDKVVYGQDNREDVCSSEDEMLKRITRESIVAFIRNALVPNTVNGTYNSFLETSNPLGSARNLCQSERFRLHPTAASCSGTLIAPDRVLTAGHCMSSSSCSGRKIVFNFFYDGADGDHCVMPDITEDDVYSCVRFQRIETSFIDYAVVHLDRPVGPGKVPVQVQSQPTPVSVRDKVSVIGFGSGIPAKIDNGGRVLDPRASTMDFFVATTDTFAGNSGSGAFNEDGLLIGILVRGQTDYITSGQCRRVNTIGCTDEFCSKVSDAEELTYPHRAITDVPNCRSDSDCPSTKRCERACAATSDECTGWCVNK